ncbi:unnamed protein product [Owenia fusiformis]|uniref:TIR domain-containing protein n=1 Tax=Owenia fusiformis TaxID=6347 RepID=A0A8S4N3I3_OWEFU|nr:unnamed protein product [Owenia fusiformis]
MGSSTMMIFWMKICIFLCIHIGETTVSARYRYPDKPDINFTMEKNHTCPHGCSICSDMRYICTTLYVTSVPQTFPASIQYLQLTDIPTVLDIQNDTFKRYTNLKYLDISGNNIKSIPEESLGGLEKLEYLKIRQSGTIIYNYYTKMSRSLKDMGQKAFCDLKTLKYLEMRGNNRMGLNRMIYSLRALTVACPNCSTDYLDLSYTNDVGFKHAQIQSYMLKRSKMIFFKRLNVKVLKLDGNHISSIEHGFGTLLSSLEYVSLRANYLSISFWHDGNIFYAANLLLMYNLKVMNIGGNAHLPMKATNPIHILRTRNCQSLPIGIEELYIDNSVLAKTFPFWDSGVCFSFPNNLKVIDFSDSIIGGLGAPAIGLTNITDVNLQNSRIEFTDPETFNCRNLPKLKTLLLGNVDMRPIYRKLNETVSTFRNCSKVTSIDLENTNNADPQVNTFTDMENVRYINLSNNGIVSLDIDLHNNLALKLLNASSNLMSQLSKSMMSQLDRIAMAKQDQSRLVVDLNFNPLLCGCSQLEFIKWMKTTQVQFHEYKSYRCLRDSKYHLLHKLNIDETTFICKRPVIVSISTSIGVMIVLVTMCCLIYTKRHRLEYLCLLSRQMTRRIIHTKKQSDDYRLFNYHGFLSYSSNDDISIIVQIQEKMENEFGLSLVIHQRDFIPGELINTNIIHFIEASRKVIILMSNNYLESRWSNFEFELSKNKRLDATYDTMVMILLHDLKDLNKDKISSSLKSYLGQKTYLQWPKDSSQNPAFWLRLKEALDFGEVQNDTPVGGANHVDSPQGQVIENRVERNPATEIAQFDDTVDDDMQPLLQL